MDRIKTITVVKGDTLSQLALDNNTTVEEIMRLNSDIKDPNLILVGQKINVEEMDFGDVGEEVSGIGETTVESDPSSFYDGSYRDTSDIQSQVSAVQSISKQDPEEVFVEQPLPPEENNASTQIEDIENTPEEVPNAPIEEEPPVEEQTSDTQIEDIEDTPEEVSNTPIEEETPVEEQTSDTQIEDIEDTPEEETNTPMEEETPEEEESYIEDIEDDEEDLDEEDLEDLDEEDLEDLDEEIEDIPGETGDSGQDIDPIVTNDYDYKTRNDEIFASLNGRDYSAKANGGTGKCGRQAHDILVNMGVLDPSFTSHGIGFARNLCANPDVLINGHSVVPHEVNGSNQSQTFDQIIESQGGSTGPIAISFDSKGHYDGSGAYGHVVVVTGVSNGTVYVIDSSDKGWNSGTTKQEYSIAEFKEHYFGAGTQANYMAEIR